MPCSNDALTISRIAVGIALLLGASGCAAPKVKPLVYGVTVSVAFDADRPDVIQVQGYADPVTRRAATADDPVRIASVSKLVTALGVMRLVEAGTLDLDRDVSPWLGWQLRNNAFPDAPITLRMLLSHQSSLTDGADYIIPLGETLENRLRDPRAWDAAHRPGSYFRYTNLNFPVVASVMEKATGERFDHLMARLVFTPLALDACFNWTTCSDNAVAHAISLTDQQGNVRRDELKGMRPACPVVSASDGSCDLSSYRPGTNGALFSPHGGVRISMRGLAGIGKMILHGGDSFLSPASIATLIGPQWRFDGANGETDQGFNCAFGMSIQMLATAQAGCRDDPFGDGLPRIGHAGEAYGLRSGLWIDRTNGTGIAFFVSAVPDDAPIGKSAFTTAEEAVLRRYKLPSKARTTPPATVNSPINSLRANGSRK